jgi:hypothetical protein
MTIPTLVAVPVAVSIIALVAGAAILVWVVRTVKNASLTIKQNMILLLVALLLNVAYVVVSLFATNWLTCSARHLLSGSIISLMQRYLGNAVTSYG